MISLRGAGGKWPPLRGSPRPSCRRPIACPLRTSMVCGRLGGLGTMGVGRAAAHTLCRRCRSNLTVSAGERGTPVGSTLVTDEKLQIVLDAMAPCTLPAVAYGPQPIEWISRGGPGVWAWITWPHKVAERVPGWVLGANDGL